VSRVAGPPVVHGDFFELVSNVRPEPTTIPGARSFSRRLADTAISDLEIRIVYRIIEAEIVVKVVAIGIRGLRGLSTGRSSGNGR
jgi:hypothetical protein